MSVPSLLDITASSPCQLSVIIALALARIPQCLRLSTFREIAIRAEEIASPRQHGSGGMFSSSG
jgi:hypothetical protein